MGPAGQGQMAGMPGDMAGGMNLPGSGGMPPTGAAGTTAALPTLTGRKLAKAA